MAIKPKKVKIEGRERKKLRIRKKVSGSEARPRLSVYRSLKHTYAQVIVDLDGRTVVSASTREPEVLQSVNEVPAEGFSNDSRSSKSARLAHALGLVIGKRCREKSIDSVVFDRNGYLYHGRVRAVAEGARQSGLKF